MDPSNVGGAWSARWKCLLGPDVWLLVDDGHFHFAHFGRRHRQVHGFLRRRWHRQSELWHAGRSSWLDHYLWGALLNHCMDQYSRTPGKKGHSENWKKVWTLNDLGVSSFTVHLSTLHSSSSLFIAPSPLLVSLPLLACSSPVTCSTIALACWTRSPCGRVSDRKSLGKPVVEVKKDELTKSYQPVRHEHWPDQFVLCRSKSACSFSSSADLRQRQGSQQIISPILYTHSKKNYYILFVINKLSFSLIKMTVLIAIWCGCWCVVIRVMSRSSSRSCY